MEIMCSNCLILKYILLYITFGITLVCLSIQFRGFFEQNHMEITKYYKAITLPSGVLVSKVQSGPCLESAFRVSSVFTSFPFYFL